MRDPLRQIKQGLLGLAFTAVTGLLLYTLVCGWSLFDAFYMLVITFSTVGYGEIGGSSVASRWVNVYVIVLGITATLYMLGGLFLWMAEGQILRLVNRQMQGRRIESLTDHHVICGFGRMGAMICLELAERKMPFVLVERDAERIALASQHGYLFVQGDAREEDVLDQAGIRRARSLVCVLPSDADNVFVALTGRDMSERLFITARAEQLSTEKKLKQAGADRVVAPQVIGAQRICNLC